MFVEQLEPCDTEYKCSYKDRADPCTDNIQTIDANDQGAHGTNLVPSMLFLRYIAGIWP